MIFKLFWLDGKVEVLEGDDIEDAIYQAGYAKEAVIALSRYEEFGQQEHPEDRVSVTREQILENFCVDDEFQNQQDIEDMYRQYMDEQQ